MIQIYNLLLHDPLLNILIFFYQTISFGDLGLAIIFLTILIRLILFPVFHKSARNQVVMQKLQPEVKKIQEKHKNDRVAQTQATLALYKDNNFKPFSSFFLLFIQLPVLFALYRVFSQSLSPDTLSGLYSFISAPSTINTSFLGLIDLSKSSIIVVALAALAQYFQGRLALPKIKEGHQLSKAEIMSRRMIFIAPFITLFIFSRFPAALSLYWLVSSLFSVGQQLIINRKLSKDGLGNIRKNNDQLNGLSGLPSGN